MKKLVLYIALSCYLGYSWASSSDGGVKHHGDHHWDLLIFTQHWPNTVCIQWKEKVENHTCLLTQEWAVHGVWPTKLGTIGPGFCNSSWPFDFQSLAPIQAQLDKYWPNIENGTQEDSLWKHEWLKHGTCAAQLPALSSELKYFSQGLRWLAQHDMTVALDKAGIFPSASSTYRVADIAAAVKKAVGTNPAIECLHDQRSGKIFLFEIRICFSKQLELVDCDGIVGSTNSEGATQQLITNCRHDAEIEYPATVPGAVDPHRVRSGWTLRDVAELLLWLQWLTF